MIVLCFRMQGEDNLERTNDKCHKCLYFSMQEQDILEHTNSKCHLYTL